MSKNLRTRARSRSRNPWRLMLNALTALVMAVATIGFATFATSTAASAAEEVPATFTDPYEVTFVWQLAPGGDPYRLFPDGQPQTLVDYVVNPTDPSMVPEGHVVCGEVYQIDRLRVENADQHAIVLEFIRSGQLLGYGYDGQMGAQWEQAHPDRDRTYGEGYFVFQTTPCVDVTPYVCDAPGAPLDPVVDVPALPRGIEHSVSVVDNGGVSTTVTVKFWVKKDPGWYDRYYLALPDGPEWSRDTDQVDLPAVATAVYTTTLEAPDCAIAPVAPTVMQSACVAPGQASIPTLTLPTTEHVTYAVDGTVAAGGSVTVTATPDAGYSIAPTDGWTVNAETGVASMTVTFDAEPDCDVTATPVAPAVTQAVCVAPGDLTPPSVTLPTTTGIDYTLAGTVAAGSKVTVTATAQAGYVLAETAGWTANSDGSASIAIALSSVTCEVPPTTPPVTPPPITPPVTTPPVKTTPPTQPPLAATGSADVLPGLAGGFLLLAVGGAVVMGARRARQH